MRTINIPIKIAIPFPFGIPDKNGVIYTKEAVKNAIDNLCKGLPIIFRNNDNYNEDIIGVTSLTDKPVVTWDDENQVCQLFINGSLMAGGTECVVNKINNGTVLNFEIVGIGVSKITPEEGGVKCGNKKFDLCR